MQALSKIWIYRLHPKNKINRGAIPPDGWEKQKGEFFPKLQTT
jgi:hypothetical protein